MKRLYCRSPSTKKEYTILQIIRQILKKPCNCWTKCTKTRACCKEINYLCNLPVVCQWITNHVIIVFPTSNNQLHTARPMRTQQCIPCVTLRALRLISGRCCAGPTPCLTLFFLPLPAFHSSSGLWQPSLMEWSLVSTRVARYHHFLCLSLKRDHEWRKRKENWK